ncbi:MAG: hypothetical protein ACP5NW_00145 [Candidatus Woesearchaeota archaeon]
MTINESISQDVYAARCRVRTVEYIINSNIDAINELNTSFPELSIKNLNYQKDLFNRLYRGIRRELQSFMEDKHVKQGYQRLENTFIRYRLAHLDKIQQLNKQESHFPKIYYS